MAARGDLRVLLRDELVDVILQRLGVRGEGGARRAEGLRRLAHALLHRRPPPLDLTLHILKVCESANNTKHLSTLQHLHLLKLCTRTISKSVLFSG